MQDTNSNTIPEKMKASIIDEHEYIKQLIALDAKYPDRQDFHANVKELLLQMGADNEFLKLVVKRNFDDLGFLNQEWSMYNIPYLLVHETDHYILKIHIFPTAKDYQEGVAAHAIHHHNNYILTTNAFFGSGYESILFDKNVEIDEKTLKTKMKISKHFHQKDWNPSMVDAWEPHIVFVPAALSATMLIWTPEKIRSTDSLRNVGLLKSLKTPLRKLIQLFKLESVFGIAKGKTYQWFTAQDNSGFMAIEEEDYFAPSKAEKGIEINNYCMQMLFSFMQQANLIDIPYFKTVLNNPGIPKYYLPWIEKAINNETIPEVYHRSEINVPQKNYYLKDILQAASQ